MSKFTPDMPFDFWQCNCGFIVADEEVKLFRFPYPCPKCNAQLETFHFHKARAKADGK